MNICGIPPSLKESNLHIPRGMPVLKMKNLDVGGNEERTGQERRLARGGSVTGKAEERRGNQWLAGDGGTSLGCDRDLGQGVGVG